MPDNLSALLFCTSKSPDQKTLPAVEKEREELKDIFLKMQNDNRLKLIEEDEYTSVDLAKRIDIVNKYQVLLHIGGHANGEKVLGADGAIYVEGICESIRLGDNQLILAFINGCSSLEQAEKYFKIGGKVVIATTTTVEDFPAKDFALRFYECLSQRDSIEQAFEKASALVKSKGYSYDSIEDLKIATRGSRSKNNDNDNKLPWRLVYQKENQEYLGWRIPLVSERLISWSENTALEVIGRETEIKDLHSRLKDKNRVVVNGLAGMGKSALAREYLKRYESDYKYTIWIDQNGTFKSSLAGHADLCEKLKLNFTEENIDTRYAAMVKKLDEIGDPSYPSLLVVDNAEVDLGDPNIALPDSKKWKILGTSRQSINDLIFEELELDKLQPEKARELFLRYYKVEGEENLELIDQILKHIDYHPLTIECSAKSLAEGYSNLEEFFDNLKNFKLDHEDSFFNSGYTKEHTSLLQHLLAIFNGRSFSEEEKTLLIQLALMPSTDLPLRHLKVLLAGNAGFEKVLAKLDRLGWIAKVRNPSTQEIFFRLHRLIKEVIKYHFSKDNETETYDIRLLWEPTKQVTQNLIDNLEDKNTSNNFELLIYYFEINRVFGKDEVFDVTLNALYSKWSNSFRLFLEALNEFSQKEYAFFEHCLEIYPEEPIVHFGLGVYFSTQKKWDNAIDAYQKAIEFDLKDVLAYLALGMALQEKGELDRAINVYQTAIEINSVFESTYHNLRDVLQDEGDLDGAIDTFKKALYKDLKDLKIIDEILRYEKSWLALGTALQAKGDLDGAIHAYYKAIELNPKDANAYYNLGLALQTKGDLDGTIHAYHKASELDPNLAMAYNNLGVALQAKGDLDGAIHACHKASELDPNLAMAYYNLGIALKDKGEMDRAIEAFNKVIQLDPNFINAYYNLGIALKDKGDLDRAIEAFNMAIQLDPNFINAYYNLGIALKDKGDLDRAIEAFNKVIQLDPNFIVAYLGLGAALKDKGELNQAIDAFQKAIQLDPKNANAYYGLGITLKDKGELNKAIDAYRKAIELSPQYSEAWNSLGWAQLLQNQLGEAKQSFLKAWQLSDEKEYTPAMNLGHIELLSENQNEAMNWYLKSVNLAKNKEEFFQGMEADYQDLKMEERGISRESYTGILAQLRLSIGS